MEVCPPRSCAGVSGVVREGRGEVEGGLMLGRVGVDGGEDGKTLPRR